MGGSSLSFKHFTDLLVGSHWVLLLGCDVQDIREDLDEVFSHCPLFCLEPLKFFLGFGRERAHALEEHHHNLITGRNDCLVDETNEKCETLGERKVFEIGCMKRTSFFS